MNNLAAGYEVSAAVRATITFFRPLALQRLSYDGSSKRSRIDR